MNEELKQENSNDELLLHHITWKLIMSKQLARPNKLKLLPNDLQLNSPHKEKINKKYFKPIE